MMLIRALMLTYPRTIFLRKPKNALDYLKLTISMKGKGLKRKFRVKLENYGNGFRT